MAVVSHFLSRKRFYFRTVSIQEEANVMQYCPIQCLFDFSAFLGIRKKKISVFLLLQIVFAELVDSYS